MHVPDHHWLTGKQIQELHNAIVPEGKRLKYDAYGNIIGDEAKHADGGLVSNTDNITRQLVANGMSEEDAFNRALLLANQIEMADGKRWRSEAFRWWFKDSEQNSIQSSRDCCKINSKGD
jgi:hypothetical protein